MNSKLHFPKVSPSFQKRATPAAFWEAWVACVLSRAGLYTLHYPFDTDPKRDHSKTWDLDVSPDNQTWTKLECKGLSLTFTCVEDFPFETVLICSRNNWEKKWPGATNLQRDFVMVSMQTGAILWIPTGTPAVVVTTTDTTRGETYKAMRTKAHYLTPFYDFVEKVRG